MSNKFIEIDRTQPILLPQNMEGWLNENDLAYFIVEIMNQIDTSELEKAYKGGGSDPYPPKMMLAMLFYCYANRIFSSRKMERATYESIPVLYIAGGQHMDHHTINKFRKRFLDQLVQIFVTVLQFAHGLGILKLGNISIDGTKIKANANKHKAMSWKHACKLEQQLKDEVIALLIRAEEENSVENKGLDIPYEIRIREDRIKKIAEIKTEIEKRAQMRYEQEKAEYDAKAAIREAKEAERGRKFGGKKPKEPAPDPRDKDQVNFIDEDSRIMPTSGDGFIQGYNAQAGTDIETMLIVSQYVSQKTNDKQEVTPALAELDRLPEALGKVEKAALDSGYFSAENVDELIEQDIEPYIPSGRQSHNTSLEKRLAEPPEPPTENATPVEVMQYRMKTPQGKKFYAKRKSTVEPVFGIIKEIMGFRHFMLRGLYAVKREWTLVCIAYNLKRLCVLNS